MGETELYHFGIKGMKWGVRRKDPSGSRKSMKTKTNIVVKNAVIKQMPEKVDKFQAKTMKRQAKVNGDAAYLKYMNDRERKGYAKGRVEVMGSKAQAIRSETTNLGLRTVQTFLKGVGSTAGSFSAGAVIASAAGKGAVDSLLAGAVGGVPVAAVSVGVLAGKSIARVSRYGKNVNAIKNVKRE